MRGGQVSYRAPGFWGIYKGFYYSCVASQAELCMAANRVMTEADFSTANRYAAIYAKAHFEFCRILEDVKL